MKPATHGEKWLSRAAALCYTFDRSSGVVQSAAHQTLDGVRTLPFVDFSACYLRVAGATLGQI